MSLKRKQPEENDDAEPNVFRSAPIEDRMSKFVAYFSPSLKPEEMQALPDIQTASHKVLGWRRESNQQSITKATQYVSGSEDDGEKYAGKRIEKVLNHLRVEGVCVVARWYGGVMLGPVRFDHIENCVRDVIDQWQRQEAEEQTKRIRLEDERLERARLSKALVERDQSIVVLRALAAEKEQAATGEPRKDENQGKISGRDEGIQDRKATVNYNQMALERLRALDKAKDATLSFLLKRIDKADAVINTRRKTTEDPIE